jgi:hypothetical protein
MSSASTDAENSSATRLRRRKRLRTLSAGLLVLTVLYTFCGFVVLPVVVKAYLPGMFAEYLNMQAEVRQVQVNPYVLSIRLGQFTAATADNHFLFYFEDLYVNSQLPNLFQQRFRFKEISLQGLQGLVKILPDGRFNFSPLIEKLPRIREELGALIQNWQVNVAEVLLENSAVDIEDRTIDEPLQLSLKPIRVELTNFTNRRNTPIPVFVSVKDQTGGTVTVSGQMTAQPLSAELNAGIDGVHLRQFAPYVESVAKIDLSGGQIRTRANIAYSSRERRNAPKLRFEGRIDIDELEAVDGSSADLIFRLQDLAVSGIDFALEPNRLKVNEVKIRKPQTDLRVDPDGKLDLKTILKPDRETVESIKRSLPGQLVRALRVRINGPLPVHVDRIRIEEGRLNAADHSVDPPFFMKVEPLNLSITHIDAAPTAQANVEIDAVVGDGSRLKAQGQVAPFSDDMSARIQASLTDFDVRELSPYSGKYAGYRLEKGNLSLSMAYTLSKRKFSGTNDVFLHQLTLGERVDSPDAINLPLEMGIALMKDRDDNITLNVPISGDLDHVDLKISGMLTNALVTVITSMVTSPFVVLGDLAGGLSAAELGRVAFEPGSDVLTDAEVEKLSKLATALRQRPALRLEITAVADRTADGQALSEKAAENEAPVNEDGLRELPKRRGQAIQAVIVKQGRVAPERIRVIAELIDNTPAGHPVSSVLSVSAQ